MENSVLKAAPVLVVSRFQYSIGRICVIFLKFAIIVVAVGQNERSSTLCPSGMKMSHIKCPIVAVVSAESLRIFAFLNK